MLALGEPAVLGGEVQASNAPSSSAHSNEAGSSAEKLNSAVVLDVIASGPLSMLVLGAVLSRGGSIVHACDAGVASVLPA